MSAVTKEPKIEYVWSQLMTPNEAGNIETLQKEYFGEILEGYDPAQVQAFLDVNKTDYFLPYLNTRETQRKSWYTAVGHETFEPGIPYEYRSRTYNKYTALAHAVARTTSMPDGVIGWGERFVKRRLMTKRHEDFLIKLLVGNSMSEVELALVGVIDALHEDGNPITVQVLGAQVQIGNLLLDYGFACNVEKSLRSKPILDACNGLPEVRLHEFQLLAGAAKRT